MILAHTIKGYGFGNAGEAQNTAHSLKKLDIEQLKAFRDRFAVPLKDEELKDVPITGRRGQPGNRLHEQAPAGTGRFLSQAP